MKVIIGIGSLAFVLGFLVTLFAGIPWLVVVEDDPVIPLWFRCAIFSFLGGMLLVLITLGVSRGGGANQAIDDGEPDESMLLVNSPDLKSREIEKELGLVQGHTIFAVWLGKDLSALMRLLIGGELTEYTEMMGRARRVAINRMIARAKDLGADGVINVRYMTNSVIGSAAELLAYGTAVKLK